MAASPSRLKLAELMSALGALVLGVGLGTLGANYLRPVGTALAAGGAVLHALGMWDKHRLESVPTTWWMVFAYWLCWVLLVVGGLYAIARAY